MTFAPTALCLGSRYSTIELQPFSALGARVASWWRSILTAGSVRTHHHNRNPTVLDVMAMYDLYQNGL